jgi:hypothetical protein
MPNSSATTGVPGQVFDAELIGGKLRQGVVLSTCTSGGVTPYHRVLTADNNAAVVKASLGQLYHAGGGNVTATAATLYLKIYDKSTSPNPAADTPVVVIPIPPDLQPPLWTFPNGMEFANGIAILVVLGIANTNNTAVAVAGDGVINLGFK